MDRYYVMVISANLIERTTISLVINTAPGKISQLREASLVRLERIQGELFHLVPSISLPLQVSPNSNFVMDTKLAPP